LGGTSNDESSTLKIRCRPNHVGLNDGLGTLGARFHVVEPRISDDSGPPLLLPFHRRFTAACGSLHTLAFNVAPPFMVFNVAPPSWSSMLLHLHGLRCCSTFMVFNVAPPSWSSMLLHLHGFQCCSTFTECSGFVNCGVRKLRSTYRDNVQSTSSTNLLGPHA